MLLNAKAKLFKTEKYGTKAITTELNYYYFLH